MPDVPLQLESFFVESLTYRARQEFDRKRPPLESVTPSVVGPFVHRDSKLRFMTRLEVKVEQREYMNSRCELEVTLVGFFRLVAKLDKGTEGAMVAQNAPAILYGIARQLVAETTGNGPWGKVFLPTFDFTRPKTTAPHAVSQADVVARDAPRRAKRKPARRKKPQG